MRTLQFTVTPDYDNRKALHFLRGSAGLSCHLVRQLKVLPDGILCNGEPVRTIDPVHTGDILTVHLPEDLPTVEPAAAPHRSIDVLYEDEDLLILNKPGDLAVHPTHNHQGDTLANLVAAYLLEEGRPSVFRAIGRLDKGTSGIVICALHSYAASRLQGKVQKTYDAFPSGLYEGTGTIELPIYRPDPGKTLRAAGEPDLERYPQASAPDHAVTHWKALAAGPDYSWLHVQLETGRTHQIRVHFAALGTPLLGDDMYGAPPFPGLSRHALHCGRAVFDHPVTGEEMTVTAPLPPDLAALTERLDKYSR